MIDTDFSQESIGPLSAPRWQPASGSDANLAVVSAGEGKAVACRGGNNLYLSATDPADVHHRAEIQFTFDTAKGTQYTGVVLRYRDANNYVLARVNHAWGMLYAEIVERVGGVETSLGLSPWTGSPLVDGGGLRLETIGRQARLWYECYPRPIPDRPPDLTVELSRDGTSAGGWGLYMNGPADSAMLITHFAARNMPAVVLPAPSASFADATPLALNFSPIHATAGDVSPEAVEIEWEVYPADPDDFPEAYRDLTVASITSRVFWVRPGFSYDLRCRERLRDGTLGEWTPFERLTALGSKAGIQAAAVPTIEFPDVTPSYVMERQQTAKVAATVSEAGRERLQGYWPAPRNSFRLVFENRCAEEYQLLIDFFEQMQGKATAFAWEHPTSGRKFALRFDADDYEVTYHDQGDGGAIASISFELVEVYCGTLTALTVDLNAGDNTAIDPDCLVDRLSELATLANEPARKVKRTRKRGTPLYFDEFNALSAAVAWLSQHVYVGAIEHPDSFVNYQAVTLTSNTQVTSRKLDEIRSALQQMRFIRRSVQIVDHQFTHVQVTHPLFSEDNVDAAFDTIGDYWGQNISTTNGGFGVVAVSAKSGGTYHGAFYLVRSQQTASHGLSLEAYIYNAQVGFDFTAYAKATQARVYVKSAVCSVPGVAGVLNLPTAAYYNALSSPLGSWAVLQDMPTAAFGAPWVGDVLPTRGGFVTTAPAFNDQGLTLIASGRSDQPSSDGATISISDEIRGGLSAPDATAFEAKGNASFGCTFLYNNIAAMDVTATSGASAGIAMRNFGDGSAGALPVNITITSALVSNSGQQSLLVEKSVINRLVLANVAVDRVIRIVGDNLANGKKGCISEVVLDGCHGNVEILGHSGGVRRCYVNNHSGTYAEVAGTIDGLANQSPGVSFIRGLPLDLATYPKAPQARSALLPEPDETVSVGWMLKEAIVLIGVAPAVVCGGGEAELDAGDGALNLDQQGPCLGDLILETMDHDPGTSSFDGGWMISPDPNNAGQWISISGDVQWQIYVFDGYWYALGSKPTSPASVIHKSPASGTCPPRDGWTLDSAIDRSGQAVAAPSGSIALVY